MRLHTPGTGMMNWSAPGILCLTLALVACSHDRMTTTESAKTATAVTIPDVKTPEATTPAAPESAKPKPVAEKPAVDAIPNDITILKPGQSASLDVSTTLNYVRLVSDSRCPVNAQCIWAGEVTIELTLESGKEKQTFTLSDRDNTKEVMGFGIELVSIDRANLVNIRARKL